MRRGLMLFGPALIVGLVITVMALRDRDRDPAFALEQQRTRALGAPQLERAVQQAPEPRPDDRGKPATKVACTPGPQPPLSNPWRCVADYPSGRRVRYTVRIQPDGRWRGQDREGVRVVYGRIAVPSAG